MAIWTQRLECQVYKKDKKICRIHKYDSEPTLVEIHRETSANNCKLLSLRGCKSQFSTSLPCSSNLYIYKQVKRSEKLIIINQKMINFTKKIKKMKQIKMNLPGQTTRVESMSKN